MRRACLGLMLVLAAACSPIVPEPMIEPVVVESPVVELRVEDCTSGELAGDDGIGGTGCPAIE